MFSCEIYGCSRAIIMKSISYFRLGPYWNAHIFMFSLKTGRHNYSSRWESFTSLIMIYWIISKQRSTIVATKRQIGSGGSCLDWKCCPSKSARMYKQRLPVPRSADTRLVSWRRSAAEASADGGARRPWVRDWFETNDSCDKYRLFFP